jgi:hypothetical protein
MHKVDLNGDDRAKSLVAMMMSGAYNDECSLKIGMHIKKKVGEPGDGHAEGEEGEIVGNMKADFHGVPTEAYLVIFETDKQAKAMTFITGHKIEAL